MKRRINSPNTESDVTIQKCLNDKRSFIVIAGAGSGKTTSLIKALKYIDDTQGERLREQGRRVACITYTTGAEGEILDDVGHDSLFHVSTIHSFLWELIRPFQSDIKKWITKRAETKLEELYLQKQNFSNRHAQTTKDKNSKDITKYEEVLSRMPTVATFKYETGSNYLEGILGHDDIIKMGPYLIKQNRLLQSVIAEKYPYFFIDESQDTVPDFVDALKTLEKNQERSFCLGFFGDPMQKIYMTGIGEIALQEGWADIKKPENFRCSTKVLRVINNIRIKGDGLEQTGGRTQVIDGVTYPVEGTAQIFILCADDLREEKIEKVRRYITQTNNDVHWLSNNRDADVKFLIIEHRMAAKRLNFSDIYSVFKDNSTESLSSSFSEGKAWPLQPFQKALLPLVCAYNDNRNFDVIELLREHCPLLQKDSLKESRIDPKEVLGTLKNNIEELAQLLSVNSESSIRDILTFASRNNLIKLDERLVQGLRGESTSLLTDEVSEGVAKTDGVLSSYFSCPANQLWGYQTYINDESPYSTQHSVKGAEFKRVMVILDDEEGKKSSSYSFEKLFGLKSLSETDRKNHSEGKETTLDRTRRLFYVSCSRAVQDLAVILFVSDVEAAFTIVENSLVFEKSSIRTESDLEYTLIS